MHLTANPIDWYAARAAGIVAYALLTVVILVGVGLAGRVTLPGWPRFAVMDVHRFIGLLAGCFVGVHVAAIAIDSFLPFSPAQLAVPFASNYRPLWTGIGIVAAELLVALAITNRLRRRIPYRVWRRLHFLNFAVWIAATLHGVGAGTDTRAPWAMALYMLAFGSVAAVLAVRLSPPRRRPVWAAGVTSGSVAAVVVVAALLAIAPAARAHRVVAAGRDVNETLTGRISVRDGAVDELVSLAGRGTGAAPVLVRVDLLVSAGGAESTSLQLEYLPGGQTCRGTVTAVASFSFDGVCRLPDGARRTVHGEWPGVTGRNTVRGTITATA